MFIQKVPLSKICQDKINSDADTAFKQIVTKKYAAAYTADSRIKVGIGVNFDSPTKELDGWYAEIL